MMRQQSHRGFTLIEMIVVIVITGIIGGMVAVFLKAPIQQYMDVARRADMTDIADTALRRIGRDLRLALPNSVQVRGAVSGAGSCNGSEICYLDFLATSGGGRYRSGSGGTNDILDFTIADTSFEVLSTPPTCVLNDQVVVYNLGITGADAYAGDNRTTCSPGAAAIVNITGMKFPFESPNARFQIVHEQVRYICNPGAQTLKRYSIAGNVIAPPSATVPAGGALLANNVSSCSFSYDAFAVAQRSGLVTMNLGITKSGETVTLYSATHVSNVP
jgi:MSHA biogenesis protein MshO